ncbi:MAG: thioredoxin family protein [Candidatus Aminicenantes bacterium]|nr:thioredoxin family protein [Candidatus Aminicenantes bacterium]
MMEAVSMDDLDRKLQDSPFVLLDFSSPGCAPCGKIAEALPALLAELRSAPPAAYEVDITREPAIAAKFFVLGVPTLILFKDGREIARFNSLPKRDTIERLLS